MPQVDKDKIAKIRSFWDEQADRHQADLAATNPDIIAKELELRALRDALRQDADTLEAGCGNGYNLFNLAEHLNGRLVGFDYSESMIGAALDRLKNLSDGERYTFKVADILDDLSDLGTYEQVFTDRCLINLPTDDLHARAIENLAGTVKPCGRLVLIESTKQGQDRINELRGMVGLDPIPYHWHNTYVDEVKFLGAIPKSLRHVRTENFASLYFLISRVFNAKLTPKGQAPDYLAGINRIAAKLPSIGDFAPLKLFLFEKLP